MFNMSNENIEKYQCPECESKTIRFKFKVNNKNKNDAYTDVTEEIQCAKCFMDIPSNIFIIDKNTNIEDNKKIWKSFYRPVHLENAAKCLKCDLYYWEIEKELVNKNIISSDIFYQTFDTKGGGGKMICRLCDPNAFINNKQ